MRATAGRDEAARLTGEAAAFKSQAEALDAQAASLDQQIQQMLDAAPNQVIEVPNKPPRPNPAYERWKAELDRVTAHRDQVRAAADTARTTATERAADAARSSAAVAQAENEATAATAEATVLRQQAAQTITEKDAAIKQIAIVAGWQIAINGAQLDREAAEDASRDFGVAIEAMRTQHATAVDAAEAADKRLWYLQTLATELASRISDIDSQLPAAAEDVVNAQASLDDVQTRTQHVLQRKPE